MMRKSSEALAAGAEPSPPPSPPQPPGRSDDLWFTASERRAPRTALGGYLRMRWHAWWDHRNPRRDALALSHRNVYILPTATGWAYVPQACQAGGTATCKLHVVLHGCKQNVNDVQQQYVRNTGYNRWADSLRLVLLYPQVRASTPALASAWLAVSAPAPPSTRPVKVTPSATTKRATAAPPITCSMLRKPSLIIRLVVTVTPCDWKVSGVASDSVPSPGPVKVQKVSTASS